MTPHIRLWILLRLTLETQNNGRLSTASAKSIRDEGGASEGGAEFWRSCTCSAFVASHLVRLANEPNAAITSTGFKLRRSSMRVLLPAAA